MPHPTMTKTRKDIHIQKIEILDINDLLVTKKPAIASTKTIRPMILTVVTSANCQP